MKVKKSKMIHKYNNLNLTMKELKTMTLKNEKINYISANDGKLELHYVENSVNKSIASDDKSILAKFMLKVGVADNVMKSSSIDFADEYGFNNYKDAQKLFDSAYQLYAKMKSLKDMIQKDLKDWAKTKDGKSYKLFYQLENNR